MFLDFEDYRPDTPSLESAISRREGVILSIAAHVVALLVILFAPQLPWWKAAAERAQQAAQERAMQMRERENTRFVFMQPKLERPKAISPRADMSDQDSVARAEAQARTPKNPLPFSRGNTPDPSDARREARANGNAAQPDPGPPARPTEAKPAEDPKNAEMVLATRDTAERPAPTERTEAKAAPSMRGGSLTDSLRNLQKYVKDQAFENPDGGAQQIGPLQFDTKGVEFGPWVRRFLAQIKRNWFVPYAAMSLKGNVVLSFNVHKDGSITDLTVVRPSTIEAFTHAAFNALAASNPTQPLPPDYPSDKAFFTVTFYYNENPANSP
ncbi:MAG: TonB family protein [Vicinamibacterales bacterium]